jgi:hypothetical protein
MKIVYRSSFKGSPKELFAFYARPAVFQRMVPPWNLLKVLSLEEEVSLKVRMWGLWRRWILKRVDIVPGSHLVDLQVKGPFSYWKHTHSFHAGPENSAVLEEEVEFRLFWGMGEKWARKKIEKVLVYQHETLKADQALLEKCPSAPLRILLSGSTGFIGKQLFSLLQLAGHEVVPLSRGKTGRGIRWNPEKGEVPQEELEGFDGVIHLAGKNIASSRWTERLKKKLFLSRCRDTWLLSQALLRTKNSPACFLAASAVGIYGNRGEEPLSEESALGEGFLADLCKHWEEASGALPKKGIRTVRARFGLVISPEGGLLKRLIGPIKWGGGAILGSGKQYLSWIALDDLIYALYHLLVDKEIEGPVNVVAPEPLTMTAFMKTLGRHLHRPIWLKIGSGPLSMVGGEMAREMVLASQRALPKRLEETGCNFRYPTLDQALNHYIK